MLGSETTSGLFEFFHGELYATVELRDTGDGWVSDWWVSRNVSGTYELMVVGYLRLPVYGEGKDEAYRRISFIYEDVLDTLALWSGGVGDTGAGGDVVSARMHCRAHLQTWGDILSAANKTEHTSALYTFAVEFGVNNPAALIAEVEVVGVRAVHDRIAYARRIGLLDSYGKGRIKGHGNKDNWQDNDQEDYGSEEGSGGGAGDTGDISSARRDDIIRRILRHGGE